MHLVNQKMYNDDALNAFTQKINLFAELGSVMLCWIVVKKYMFFYLTSDHVVVHMIVNVFLGEIASVCITNKIGYSLPAFNRNL